MAGILDSIAIKWALYRLGQGEVYSPEVIEYLKAGGLNELEIACELSRDWPLRRLAQRLRHG